MATRLLAAALLVLAGTGQAAAQRIIYDGGRDTTATQASAAAKDITSGALFETMLRNVDAQAKVEADTMLAYLREHMRARLIALEVWWIPGLDLHATPGTAAFAAAAQNCPKSVECLLRDLRERHLKALESAAGTADEVKGRLTAIEAKVVALDVELKALEAAAAGAKVPRIDQVFALLEEHGNTVLTFAREIEKAGGDQGRLKGATKALDAIAAGLDQVLTMYHVTRDIWTSRGLVTVDPASLRPPPQETELQLLRIEQDHLATVARIEARRQLEVGAALARVNEAINLLGPEQANLLPSTSATPVRIEDTLRALSSNRPRLLLVMKALHAVAASTAQMQAANELAGIRQADEARRFSIRQSGIHSTTYEVAIRAASERLAAYWKRGLKAGEVAELAAWLANTAALVEVSRKD